MVTKDHDEREFLLYYGKKDMSIPIGELRCINEYGFNTASGAYKKLKRIARWFDEEKIKYSGMRVISTEVKFASYEDYLSATSINNVCE